LRLFVRLLSALALLTRVLPLSAQRTPPPRVLFIGNSYTYWNDLPMVVRALADSAGATGMEVEAVTAPGASLEDLWNEGTARERIGQGGWNVVVLQQGPSSQREGRRLLRSYAVRFAEEIRRQGGIPALFMVWPARERSADFNATRDSYTAAAAEVDGALFPAAEAWRAAWRRDPSLTLYSNDDLHPSRLGSYLAALVMVSELLDRSPVGLPGRISVDGESRYTLDVAAPVMALLQEAAAEAVAKHGRSETP
jgi:hypothetical protein